MTTLAEIIEAEITSAADEIARLEAENERLRHLVAFLVQDTSAGFSRGRVRCAAIPGPPPILETFALDI